MRGLMRTIQRLFNFLWHYKQFSFALLALLVASGLRLGGLTTASHWVLGIASIISVQPLVGGMWQDFRHGQYGLDILALTAIISAVWLKEYWAAVIVVLMLTGGESLEDYAER